MYLVKSTNEFVIHQLCSFDVILCPITKMSQWMIRLDSSPSSFANKEKKTIEIVCIIKCFLLKLQFIDFPNVQYVWLMMCKSVYSYRIVLMVIV